MELIKANDLSKTFGKKDATVQALEKVSVEINNGEYVAIMGKSGSGKSTLLNIIGGLMEMDSGEFYYKGTQLDFSKRKVVTDYRRSKIGFIVQYFALIDDLTVFDNIALSLRYKKMTKRQMKKEVESTLEDLGISDKAKAYPNELSGGQQQRVAIARAIIKKPEIILADEPTGALDEATEQDVLDLFGNLNKKGMTIVLVTHDDKVASCCDRIIRLRDGQVE